MSEFPKRSRLTELSDDQLYLLDFLATRGDVPMRMLRRDAYSFHMNTAYSHGIPDNELARALLTMIRENILLTTRSEWKPKEIRYGLTPHGGRLWCRERMPVWERYCKGLVSYGPLPVQAEVSCVEKYIGQEFLAACRSTGYIAILEDPEDAIWEPMPPEELVPWCPPTSAWRCAVKRDAFEDPNWNRWAELEERRTWWDGLGELQKFVSL